MARAIAAALTPLKDGGATLDDEAFALAAFGLFLVALGIGARQVVVDT